MCEFVMPMEPDSSRLRYGGRLQPRRQRSSGWMPQRANLRLFDRTDGFAVSSRRVFRPFYFICEVLVRPFDFEPSREDKLLLD